MNHSPKKITTQTQIVYLFFDFIQCTPGSQLSLSGRWDAMERGLLLDHHRGSFYSHEKEKKKSHTTHKHSTTQQMQIHALKKKKY